VRLYIIRTPHFNATMMPNGAMQIWTGTLLRLRNEAQLAAVLGHEFAHFERKHSLQNFRAIRGKTDAMAWLSFFGLIGAIASIGVLGSIFSFSQDMEREADVASLDYMRSGGYAPGAASAIWGQVMAEGDATAIARQQKKRRHQGGGFLDSHPATADRMAYLGELARKGPPGAVGPGEEGVGSYRIALADWWAPLIDDQVKLNDFGGTEFLLDRLSEQGWTSELLYARGELYRSRAGTGDFEKSVEYYRGALAAERPVAEAWRGLGLSLLRTDGAEEGRQALRHYLELRPAAPDKSMITMLAGG
jgi:beta-barrel assembly-enhancing protease